MATKTLNLNQYLGGNISCSCGREHTTSLNDIVIGKGALARVPELAKKYNHQKVFLISDINTFEIAGRDVKNYLEENQISVCNFVFPDKDLIPDETALGKLLVAIEEDCDLVISVGSGTLNDLGKFISHKLKLDFFVVGTAPSMDGYASNVSPLIVNHLKTTYVTHIPTAVIGDLDILKEAPMIMIGAGVGDILGKYICLIDWKVANLIQEEYYCPYVADLVKQSIEAIVSNIDKIKQRDEEAIAAIMEGLILSGIAMSYIGNSRPASGSEHHLSHFWEMMFLFQGKPAVLHGIKVGIGTVTTALMYQELKSKTPDFEAARKKAADFESKAWEIEIRKAYLSASETVIAFEQTVHKNASENVLPRLDILEKKWSSLLALLEKSLPTVETLCRLLRESGAPVFPYEVMIDRKDFNNSLLYAKDIRNRYGLLQLLFDLGLTEEVGQIVSDKIYSQFNNNQEY